jgi:ABC-2 type transport system ATP-binding protein
MEPMSRPERSGESAIVVDDVTKGFRIYHERNQTLKASLMRRKRMDYEDFLALDHVSFDVAEGETIGLIGENGSGKSTLLKCMARILRPDSGAITVNGKASALLELGAGFHHELSGRENVYLNGSILGLSKKDLDRKFDDIVDFAGLDRFIDTPVKNYSSGMYVRLGFSVAINVDPDVLLVDEVLAVGDENFQRKCNEKFAELREAGKTIVIVSHAMGSVRNLCDRVAWLEHGVLKELGPAGTVIEADENGGSRWGSGEARIERVELIGGAGAPTHRVKTGDPVTIRFHYEVSEAIDKPVFGLAIYSLEGVQVTGPNTRDAEMVPDRLGGSGHVDLTIDRLLLTPGTYDLSASIYDFACLHPYDFRHRSFRFDVEHGEPRETYGVTSLGGRWSLS